MSTRQDLSAASREELLAVIAQQQAIIEQLQQRIAELEARLGGHGSGGPPGNKPAQAKPLEEKPRKRREQGFGRSRMAPTRRIEHAVEECPDCGTDLRGGWVQRTREVIELPLVPVEVAEHVYIARVCPLCRKRRVPKAALTGAVVGQQRLGVNLVSLIVTLREEGRLPVRTIQWYLRTVHQLELSVGAIVNLLQRVATQAQSVVAGIQQQVRASPAVCADETGWREDGRNGYVWTFSTPTARLFLRRGRNKEVVDEVLGEDFSGVLVSDFYAAYDHYAGLHQRCWPHLLRDIYNLKLIYPADAALAEWAQAVQGLYEEAKAFRSDDPRRRLQAQERLERRLLELALPYAEDPLAVQARLCRRIGRFIKQLFVFVGHPSVPGDNNQAERSLRRLVTCRKISGGTRSPQGSTTKMVLASLFGTWRAQRLNPFLQSRQLLVSP